MKRAGKFSFFWRYSRHATIHVEHATKNLPEVKHATTNVKHVNHVSMQHFTSNLKQPALNMQ